MFLLSLFYKYNTLAARSVCQIVDVVGGNQEGVARDLRLRDVEVFTQQVVHEDAMDIIEFVVAEGERLVGVLEPEAVAGPDPAVGIGDDRAEGLAEGGAGDVDLGQQPDERVDAVDLAVERMQVIGEGEVVGHKVVEALGRVVDLVPYNTTLADNMRSLYGKVNRIDPLVGLLAEVHVPGTSFGETLGSIIMDTYRRIRDGDRYWFENPNQPYPYSDDHIEEIHNVFMDDLLRANFDIPPTQVPGNPFLVPANYATNLANTPGC